MKSEKHIICKWNHKQEVTNRPLVSWPRCCRTWERDGLGHCRSRPPGVREDPPCRHSDQPTQTSSCRQTWSATSTCQGSRGSQTHSGSFSPAQVEKIHSFIIISSAQVDNFHSIIIIFTCSGRQHSLTHRRFHLPSLTPFTQSSSSSLAPVDNFHSIIIIFTCPGRQLSLTHHRFHLPSLTPFTQSSSSSPAQVDNFHSLSQTDLKLWLSWYIVAFLTWHVILHDTIIKQLLRYLNDKRYHLVCIQQAYNNILKPSDLSQHILFFVRLTCTDFC